MNFEYDVVANAVYLRINTSDVAKTLVIQDHLNVDVDKDGGIVGLEILDASSNQNLVENLKKSAKTGVPVTIADALAVAQ